MTIWLRGCTLVDVRLLDEWMKGTEEELWQGYMDD